ncbi:VOC family protein [Streptomyces sp. NPDC088794]|uniref:VOC family protein n=1 Tax=Streptomyces sp. NPDC088794 TaxID=3365902 RepID=UPI0037F74A68
MTATVDGPDFIALQVRDLEAAALFCEKHLGLRRLPVGPPGAVVFDTKPCQIAVREPLPGTDLDTGRPGLGVAIWLTTTDAAALHAQLTAADVEVLTPVMDNPFGQMFTFVGPEGYVLTAYQA